MNQNLTEIICIIDRSGSMESVRTDAIGGFNAFLATQQQQEGEARLTLVLFDHEYERVIDNMPIADVPKLTEASYVPRGTTALYDAIGRTFADVGGRLAKMSESERPGQVIVAILTDGLENASRDYDRAKIAEMIKHQREAYSWEFIFLAANQDAFAAAEGISIARADTAPFAASPVGTQVAYQWMSQEVTKKRGLFQRRKG